MFDHNEGEIPDSMDITDPESVLYQIGGEHPLRIADRQNVVFHCHRATLMESVSACMQFIDDHDLETPDMENEWSSFTNPVNGKTLEWYEGTVKALLPEGATITIHKENSK